MYDRESYRGRSHNFFINPKFFFRKLNNLNEKFRKPSKIDLSDFQCVALSDDATVAEKFNDNFIPLGDFSAARTEDEIFGTKLHEFDHKDKSS